MSLSKLQTLQAQNPHVAKSMQVFTFYRNF